MDSQTYTFYNRDAAFIASKIRIPKLKLTSIKAISLGNKLHSHMFTLTYFPSENQIQQSILQTSIFSKRSIRRL